MHVVICDDENLCVLAIEEKIKLWAQKTGQTSHMILHSFSSSEDLLEAFHHGMLVDALFLDIQIPGEMSGLALAKEIHQINAYIPIVFITSYGEYAEEGYTANALRYLRKPVSGKALAECMNIIFHQWKVRRIEFVMFEQTSQILRLPVDSILYVEAHSHHCVVHTVDDQQTYQLKQTLDTIARKLPAHLFVQCHRSYIINLMYVRRITRTYLILADETMIPVSRNEQNQLVQKFRQFFLEGDNSKC